ncbi:hypothetical protein MTO96_027992, partial [Rhipicephalus appendiculatus]
TLVIVAWGIVLVLLLCVYALYDPAGSLKHNPFRDIGDVEVSRDVKRFFLQPSDKGHRRRTRLWFARAEKLGQVGLSGQEGLVNGLSTPYQPTPKETIARYCHSESTCRVYLVRAEKLGQVGLSGQEGLVNGLSTPYQPTPKETIARYCHSESTCRVYLVRDEKLGQVGLSGQEGLVNGLSTPYQPTPKETIARYCHSESTCRVYLVRAEKLGQVGLSGQEGLVNGLSTPYQPTPKKTIARYCHSESTCRVYLVRDEKLGQVGLSGQEGLVNGLSTPYQPTSKKTMARYCHSESTCRVCLVRAEKLGQVGLSGQEGLVNGLSTPYQPTPKKSMARYCHSESTCRVCLVRAEKLGQVGLSGQEGLVNGLSTPYQPTPKETIARYCHSESTCRVYLVRAEKLGQVGLSGQEGLVNGLSTPYQPTPKKTIARYCHSESTCRVYLVRDEKLGQVGLSGQEGLVNGLSTPYQPTSKKTMARYCHSESTCRVCLVRAEKLGQVGLSGQEGLVNGLSTPYQPTPKKTMVRYCHSESTCRVCLVRAEKLGQVSLSGQEGLVNGLSTPYQPTPKKTIARYCHSESTCRVCLVRAEKLGQVGLSGQEGLVNGLSTPYQPTPKKTIARYCHSESTCPVYLVRAEKLGQVGLSGQEGLANGLLRRFFCCASDTEDSPQAYEHMAEYAAYLFEDVDITPSDMFSALVLLRKKQRRQLARMGSTSEESREGMTVPYYVTDPSLSAPVDKAPRSNGVSPGAAATPAPAAWPVAGVTSTGPHPWMNPEQALYYLKFAWGIYGWPAYMASHVLTGLCDLWAGIRCCTCLRGGSGNVSGDNCCECHAATVKHLTRVRPEDLLFSSFANGLYRVPFYVALDHRTNAILVVARGTLSVADALTDSVTATAKMPDGVGLCHQGVLQSALQILGQLDEPLAQATARHPNYTLVLTGHSLGAAVASVLGILLRPRFPSLRCYAFSPPGGILDVERARETRDFVMTIVVGDDLVCRLGFTQVNKFKRDVVSCLLQCDMNKNVLNRHGLEALFCCRRLTPPLKDKEAFEKINAPNGKLAEGLRPRDKPGVEPASLDLILDKGVPPDRVARDAHARQDPALHQGRQASRVPDVLDVSGVLRPPRGQSALLQGPHAGRRLRRAAEASAPSRRSDHADDEFSSCYSGDRYATRTNGLSSQTCGSPMPRHRASRFAMVK